MTKYQEFEEKLNAALAKLGMGIAFRSGADFSKIFGGAFISEVRHKTYVTVNEEGKESLEPTQIQTAPVLCKRSSWNVRAQLPLIPFR